jgi:hypothetical protein
LSIYVLVQFAAILIAHSHFLALLPKQSAVGNTLYFLFLVLSLALLGGLLENRRIFRMLESGRLIVSAAFVLAMGGWFGNLRGTGSRTAIVLFALLSLGWLLGTDCGIATRKSTDFAPAGQVPDRL